ncbi:MAG: hypothetical protein K0R20_818 [Actinomycetia bacterium]|jgi:hypothetical protein|nr:hypothetical protein [Actinomycetes bacterium]
MRATLIAVGFALMVTPAGCADDPEGAGKSTTPTATASVSSQSASPSADRERWIAVIDVAADPNDLDALTQRLLEPLGTALVVAPVDCFEGLPDAASDGYVIGAVGDARSEVERRVVDAGETAAFTARVTILCTD